MDQRTLSDFAKKLLSRKLLVWVVSTVLLCFKIISQEIWQTLTITFMGVHAAQAVLTGVSATAMIKSKVESLKNNKEDEGEA